MTRGFVTVATGHKRYYQMASNLLMSYRDNCSERMPFALITDKQSDYSKEFDDVVVLENAQCSWMDKMRILDACPYDENIFIDADCLIYHDINYLWDLFATADDFSCFGKALPIDSPEGAGWFTKESISMGGYHIHFVTHLHGIIYFVRKSEAIKEFSDICSDIINNYHKMRFKGFNDKMADEPVFALGMAIMGLKPIHREAKYYCFAPYATRLETNYSERKVVFENPTDGLVGSCDIIHWGNLNTQKPQYKFEVFQLRAEKCKSPLGALLRGFCKAEGMLKIYRATDAIKMLCGRLVYIIKRIPQKLIGK